MTRPPGFTKRLLSGLTQNVAETADDSPFPELRVGSLTRPAAEAYEDCRQAMRQLGWEIIAEDPRVFEIRAVVTTRVLRFRDDVTLRIRVTESGSDRLWIRSASRIGKGDLGANRRHIVRLLRQLAGR